jgi:transposase
VSDVPELESLSRGELIVLARRQQARIAEQDATIVRQQAQIVSLTGQLAEMTQQFELIERKLARLEHLLSRNSANSSLPSSRDDDPGRRPPEPQKPAPPRSKRKKGKQPGAPGSVLAWSDSPDRQLDRFPLGACGCGANLAAAADLGVVDRYQQVEIPLVTATCVQYDQHAVQCGCGTVHTAARPKGAGSGRVEYGPRLKAFAVYLMVVHFIPVARCRDILTALTGAEPSIGFVHALLRRVAQLLAATDKVIRTLITLAFAICCDETPLKVGSATPSEGKKEAKGYLLVACTDAYTHFLLGDRSMDTFKAFIFTQLTPEAVIVHDRYQNYDSVQLGDLNHQLCLAHVLRDLQAAAELYPGQLWPVQLADELRELIHRANQARERGETRLSRRVTDLIFPGLRSAVRIGLTHTAGLHDDRPGARKTRLLLEALRDRETDFVRFTTDLRIPPTSNQAERDLRPAKIQEKISGRLTHLGRARDRYLIRGVLSTAIKHALDPLAVLADAFTGKTWQPPAAAALA